ncbi:MAG TPA: 6-bladed beta-propeller [Candidatus Acidoferrales bacterium]|nr:6-bladed beta-propeller [Candidatus Acidoferrales bacterium]
MALASGQAPPSVEQASVGQAPPSVEQPSVEQVSVEFRHLYTFGSKDGIHPATVLNRRPATAALGKAENPYGLVFPVAVVTDLRRRVWITDSGTASVHVFDIATGAYREIRRVGDVPLRQPSGLAVDGQGRIFLTDSGTGAVFMFDEKGEFQHALLKPGEHFLEGPTAIALSEDGKTIYVADPPKNVVVELNREGEVNGTISLPPELGEPAAISVVDNQVYVLGNRQHRVGIFSPAGSQRGELRWDGIQFPSAFTYDVAHRRFLVANPRWMTVEIFNGEARNLGAFGQLGEGVDQMQRVDSLHVDPQGLLYLVDSHHGKVLVFADSTHVL